MVTTASSGLPTLDNGNTTVLYGNQAVLDGSRSGGRVRFGNWFDPCQTWGIEAEYLGFTKLSSTVSISSDSQGNPILGRPFFNMNPRSADGQADPPARDDVQLISDPDVLSGTGTAVVESKFHSAGLYLRRRLFCAETCVPDLCSPCRSVPRRSRLDLLLGYRYLRLSENLSMREDLDTLSPPSPITTLNEVITDDFSTRNSFHGADLGMVWQIDRDPWSLEFLGRLGLGSTHEVVVINGSTVRTADGVAQTFSGGLLAQSTNIGQHERSDFAVVPEIGATLGVRVAPCLRLTVGYSLIYWSRVVRPGDQIDLDVNPDYLPSATTPVTGPARPRFVFRESDFWAQGLSVGGDLRW